MLDGAYADYIEDWDGGARFVESHNNVVMLRTLSKMYGLGGAARGLGLWAATCDRCAQPGARTLQPLGPSFGGW